MHANTLFTGDNLPILQGMRSGSVDLIYLDPPFNSKRLYKAPIGGRAAGAEFKDMWKWTDVDDWRIESLIESHAALASLIMVVEQVHGEAMAAYLCYMSLRIIELHRVLKSTGSIYLHCDPTASHYLKGLMDAVFGKLQFRNEIIWTYNKFTSKRKNNYPNNYDIILFYAKSSGGYFKLPYMKKDTTHSKRGYVPQSFCKDIVLYDKEMIHDKRVKKYIEKGYTVKYAHSKGVTVNSSWTDISAIGSNSKERTGYPTQKPLALLNRIIKASSNEGDIVLDPFCGCATACVSAQNLSRKWIGIDISDIAASLVSERLVDIHGKIFTNFVHRTDVPMDNTAEVMPINISTKDKLVREFGEQCNGCGLKVPKRNLEIDHIIPKSKGGGDYYENLQLLCGHCNRTKGDRPQEYLLAKIKKTQDTLRERVTFGIRGKA